MKVKVNKLEENSKNKNIRKIYKGYEPHAYVIKKHYGTIIVTETTSILSR
jgi:hypothetical protein